MATDPAATPTPGGKNPMALSLADLAAMLSRFSTEPLTEDMLEDDVADGCPTNPDGTMNVVQFSAWMVKEMGRGD